jgi:hypothetical protein
MTLTFRRRLAMGLILAAPLLSSWISSSASACSPAAPCRQLNLVRPADGATDIPRNIELRVSYRLAPHLPQGGAAVLESDDGQVVPTTWESATRPYATELWIGRPTAPLAAATHYRLRHPYRPCSSSDAGPNPYGCEGLCVSAPGDVISEFTTGAGSAEKVLNAPVLAAPVLNGVERTSDNGASCGAYTLCHYSVEVTGVASDRWLRVRGGGRGLVGDFGSPLQFGVHSSGILYDGSVAIFQSGEQTYRVSIVDSVGNESPATTLSVPACTPQDGGVSGTDAGASPPDGGASVLDGAVSAPDGAVSAPDGTVSAPDGAASAPDGRVPATSQAVGSERDGGAASVGENDDGCTLAGARSSCTAALWMALAIVVRRRR